MKRELFYNFDFARRIKDAESKGIELPPELLLPEVQKEPKDSLLKVIYAPDSRTGLPTGDLTYYVSDKANPQVKQFILDNLLMDVSSAKNPAIPEGIDSTLAFDLMRKQGEGVQEYAERLNQFSSDNKQYAQMLYDKSRSVPKASESTVDSE